MNSRTKNILIGVLLVGIISMTIVYAALSQQLNISGSAKVQSKSQSWNIHFQHITNTANEVQVEQYATVQSSSISLTDTNTTATLPTVTFKAPGDKVTYLFDVINEGDITGYINVINDISIPDVSGAETYKAAIIKTFTYADNDAEIRVNDSIAKNEVKHLKVILQLSSDLETLPNAEVTFSNITASLVYGQDTVSGGNSGSGGNEPVTPSNPYETTFNGNYTAYKWLDVEGISPIYEYDFNVETDEIGDNECPDEYVYFSGDMGHNEGCYNATEKGWYTTLNPESKAYLRTTGSLPEVCGVFGSGQAGTVCMTSSYYNSDYSNGYYSDFEDVSNYKYDITTSSGLQATGLKGYSLAKAEEMLTKGASLCDVDGSYVLCNVSSGSYCYIYSSGRVSCNGGSGDDVGVNNDGSAN